MAASSLRAVERWPAQIDVVGRAENAVEGACEGTANEAGDAEALGDLGHLAADPEGVARRHGEGPGLPAVDFRVPVEDPDHRLAVEVEGGEAEALLAL